MNFLLMLAYCRQSPNAYTAFPVKIESENLESAKGIGRKIQAKLLDSGFFDVNTSVFVWEELYALNDIKSVFNSALGDFQRDYSYYSNVSNDLVGDILKEINGTGVTDLVLVEPERVHFTDNAGVNINITRLRSIIKE